MTCFVLWNSISQFLCAYRPRASNTERPTIPIAMRITHAVGEVRGASKPCACSVKFRSDQAVVVVGCPRPSSHLQPGSLEVSSRKLRLLEELEHTTWSSGGMWHKTSSATHQPSSDGRQFGTSRPFVVVVLGPGNGNSTSAAHVSVAFSGHRRPGAAIPSFMHVWPDPDNRKRPRRVDGRVAKKHGGSTRASKSKSAQVVENWHLTLQTVWDEASMATPEPGARESACEQHRKLLCTASMPGLVVVVAMHGLEGVPISPSQSPSSLEQRRSPWQAQWSPNLPHGDCSPLMVFGPVLVAR
mmetsp:Transcript_169208/g.544005  ORF Transcript_169208/g.544005 Transcript_169208/m.544005 type:complete len:299 (-) Transcript_169208:118-1014(-)